MIDLSKIEAIVIGCSAGGIDALTDILPRLPKGYSKSVIVVIHLAPQRDSLLPEVFGPKCNLPVLEATDKEKIRPGVIYFAPADYHLLIENDFTFSLSIDEAVNYSRPSIDVLFESAAVAYRDKLLGIILTGANSDGAQGLLAVAQAGGIIAAQDPSTAEQPTMPEAAIQLARPSVVLKTDELARWIASLPQVRGKGGV